MSDIPWNDVVEALNTRFPKAAYAVLSLTDVEGPSGRIDLEALVVGKSASEPLSLKLDDWGAENDSYANGPAAEEAFILLLHALLDEEWSATAP
jgi:hypothetical protein